MINKKIYVLTLSFFIVSCSSIESTIDSTLDSISEAGDYIYDFGKTRLKNPNKVKQL